MAEFRVNLYDLYDGNKRERKKNRKQYIKYIELQNRLKVISAVAQLTIDAQKGVDVQKIPENWIKYQSIITPERYRYKINKQCLKTFGKSLEELESQDILSDDEQIFIAEYETNIPIPDDEITIADKKFTNSVLINNDYKPYFFIYRESDLKKRYLKYVQSKSSYAPCDNPVNESDSVMNTLCKYIEDYKFHTRATINKSSEKCLTDKKWIWLMKSHKIKKVEKNYQSVLDIYKEYSSVKQFSYSDLYCDDEDIITTINSIDEYYREKFLSAVKNESELANYLIYILYELFPKREKRALWKFAGNAVVENLKNNMEENE